MQVGRTLYYDISTGNVLCDTGEREGDVTLTTKDEDFAVYPQLQGVDQSTIGTLQLSYGQYSTEYQTGHITNVDPSTQSVTFTPYPTATNP